MNAKEINQSLQAGVLPPIAMDYPEQPCQGLRFIGDKNHKTNKEAASVPKRTLTISEDEVLKLATLFSKVTKCRLCFVQEVCGMNKENCIAQLAVRIREDYTDEIQE
jgi:hypothetical protein